MRDYLFQCFLRIIEIWPQFLFRADRNSLRILRNKQIYPRQGAAAGFVSCFRENTFSPPDIVQFQCFPRRC